MVAKDLVKVRKTKQFLNDEIFNEFHKSSQVITGQWTADLRTNSDKMHLDNIETHKVSTFCYSSYGKKKYKTEKILSGKAKLEIQIRHVIFQRIFYVNVKVTSFRRT